MNLKDFIRSIQDYPKKGILFRDITTLIKDENAFEECIKQIVERSKKFNFDKIAAIESRGFVFASAVSYVLKKPFVMLRKKINYLRMYILLILNSNMGQQQLRFTKTRLIRMKIFLLLTT